MNKVIKLNELDLVNLVGRVLSEVKRDEDFSEFSPEYHYVSVGLIPNKFKPDEIGTVFFNGPVFNQSEYKPSEHGGDVIFMGPLGEFRFNEKVVNYKGKSPYVFGRDLIPSYYDILAPLMKPKEVVISTNSEEFNAIEINEALKQAFKEYWKPETEEYTSGIRGIHTIGEKSGSDVDWSIMNYFDTKSEVKVLINQKWEEEGSGNKIEWLSSVFKDDENFLNKLLKIQWNSIKNGVENEDRALENLINTLMETGIEFTYEVYSPGHKKDRYDATDLKLSVEGKRPVTIQIKPYNRTEELPNGDTKVYTYGMRDSYKDKSGLDYILYNNGDNFIMYRNKNYEVVPDTNGREVIHKDKPSKTK
jgi:hypothetical protein